MNLAPAMRVTGFAIAASVWWWTLAAQATAGQPGTLDTTFNATGKVRTTIGSGSAVANAVLVQPDGKIVLAGYCPGVSNADYCALRYNANGTLDGTFGSGGKAITAIGTGADIANAIARQADGKLVLAGSCVSGGVDAFCALRYNTNGTTDGTFNTTGKVITVLGTGNAVASALVLQADGKIVLAGNCSTDATFFSFCALRYNSNGTLDTAGFGASGVATNSIATGDDVANAIALQPDGKLVLAGICYTGSNADFCALRLNSNGTLDSSFNSPSGSVTTAVGTSNDIATALILQPDGKIVLTGNCRISGIITFCALRYNANGTLDSTFGTAGSVFTQIGSGNATATAATLQPDGKIVLAGYCHNGTNNDFCALRYHANGTLDPSFGSGGTVVTAIGSSTDQANAVALQADGKMVLAGYCLNGSTAEFCALRYDGGPFGYKYCSLDLDGDGIALTATDSLIHARIALGVVGNAAITGISFPVGATRTTWPLIRDYLVTQCGMSIVQ